MNVFSIYDELERRSARRMRRVAKGSMSVCFAVYSLMGIFGVLDFGPRTNGNILKNYCLDDTRTSPSGVIVAAYVAITLTVVMAFPLVIFPCRYTVEVMIMGHDMMIQHKAQADEDAGNVGRLDDVNCSEGSRIGQGSDGNGYGRRSGEGCAAAQYGSFDSLTAYFPIDQVRCAKNVLSPKTTLTSSSHPDRLGICQIVVRAEVN